MALITLVGKTFALCQKSAKTVKVIFHVGFAVYGMRFTGSPKVLTLFLSCLNTRS